YDLVEVLGEVVVVRLETDEVVAGDLVLLVGAADGELGLAGLAENDRNLGSDLPLLVLGQLVADDELSLGKRVQVASDHVQLQGAVDSVRCHTLQRRDAAGDLGLSGTELGDSV